MSNRDNFVSQAMRDGYSEAEALDEYNERYDDMGADDYDEDTGPEAKPLRLERFVGVTAYTVGLANRAYGGPEEGGWWYDTFEPVRVFYVTNKRSARVRLRLEALCKRMNKAEGRRDPSSVSCDGYWTVSGGAVTRPQPEGRPYYS